MSTSARALNIRVDAPYNMESEGAVLGAVLLDDCTFNVASDMLEDNDFFNEQNRIIFRAMKSLAAEGVSIDDFICIELENTHEISKLCTKPDVYEIVKIKSGFPDETKVHNLFRICPSWKGVCITILKNDFSCLYMGCQRTKDQNLIRHDALERYKKLQLAKQLKEGKAHE